jgi:hypothetical protein
VRDDYGGEERVAVEDQDFRIIDRPRAMAHKLTRRDA